jgi:hypothetical protein
MELITQQKRRTSFDVNDPLTGSAATRVSFATDDSGSYYNDMYSHQQSLFGSMLTCRSEVEVVTNRLHGPWDFVEGG